MFGRHSGYTGVSGRKSGWMCEHREGVMKITADNLLGSAQKINSKRNSAIENSKMGSESRTDRADIAAKVDSRMDSIQNEMKNLQTDLSKNQIMKEGVNRTVDEMGRGGNVAAIINEVRYNDKKVLLDYLNEGGDQLTMQVLSAKKSELDARIARDTKNLTKLQVETENIFASNFAKGEKAGSLLERLNEIINAENTKSLSPYSGINPESVMRLIR
jgi:hypothetical protein